MSVPRVVLYPGGTEAIARALAEVDGIDLATPSDPGGVAARLNEGCDVLVSWRWRDEFLTPSLRWVQSVSTGVEQFPHDRLRDAGVVLTSARGVHGPQMADHAFGLLLALTRGIATAVRNQEKHRWQWPTGIKDLTGLTVGVLGMGSIGEEIARRAQAWDLRVIGTKRTVEGYAGRADAIHPPEETRTVCQEADILIIVLPGGEETHHLVGAEELAALGRGWLINLGRGSVVDTEALIDALTEGELRGAGLDVFEEEPLGDDSPLWDMPNVVITPHMAGVSPHYGERLVKIFKPNLDAYLGRGEWVNRVL